MIMMLWGAGLGLSAVAVVSGLRPPMPSLAEAQRRIAADRDASRSPQPQSGTSPSGAAAGLLSRFGIPNRKLRDELVLLGSDAGAFGARKILNAVIGLVMPSLAQLVLVAAGLAVPALAVLGAGAVLSAVFFMAPDSQVHRAAQTMRDQTREALDVLLSVAATSMLAGDGVKSALEGAAAIGEGAAFEHFRDAAAAADTSRRTVWACYGDLGDRLGVADLAELGATLSLAGGEGAKIADSLAAKAASLRGRRKAELAAANVSATERMYAPVGVILLGFLLLLIFPSFSRIITSF